MKYPHLLQLIGVGLGLAGFAIAGQAIALHRNPSLETLQPIEANSSLAQASAKQSLALHLKQINAKMYGAYWCPACKKQIEVFGSQAFRQINYIECDPGGANAQPKVCANAKIRAYPTWEINGKMYEGAYPLKALAQISGYRGPMNF
ncbi:hypothetical protein L3556_12340 [Candidatus Synechococcus calcipolaris G9]|uniref:Vitamin K epoxide reductase n=1 Tax=Candidatus Synechococcus calcipolaris G9 TaxID=1497997 RepID=A0ABT6F1K0_9SYNE|nr:hypothetical protein [Candidatus Synechococcus calcipolaris]MDG2991714.1 hypothetical protein [Candidatus Synechococcus calcipolaris G9]